MTGDVSVGRRRRNSILEGLEEFRRNFPGMGLPAIIAFFYISENEGLCVSELAAVGGLSLAAASRAAKELASPTGEDGAQAPLIEVRRRRQVKCLHLTPAGKACVDRLDEAIRRAVTIKGDAQGPFSNEKMNTVFV